MYQLTEHTIDKHGHALVFPQYILQGWTSTLAQKFNATQVIALYCDHAKHEQCDSEFKTDMDLQRLPSCRFYTNHLVHQLAKRRRIKTVMQKTIFKAARMIKQAG